MTDLSKNSCLCLTRLIVGLAFVALLLLSSESRAETPGLSKIVDRVVTDYNNQDAAQYRSAFSTKLGEHWDGSNIQGT